MTAEEKTGGERSPAEIYERHFVPALFGQWGPRVAEAAGIAPGQQALDVACGTGALTRAVVERLAGRGSVIGLDSNPEMLAVARGLMPRVDWREASAESLPFGEGEFDAVVSQFGLMFFEDRVGALREALRVLKPGGRLVVAVCDALDHSSGYAVLSELLHRLFGPDVAEAFRAPFVCGDRELLQDLCRQAGIPEAEVTRSDGSVRFASIDALVATERACAWTLGGLLDDDQFARLTAAAQESLAPFAGPDGTVDFTMPVLMIRARK
ncbi:MAG: methyltransferase type 11 [Porticoccaceae bacterium]|nr:methyltransferase type 11 [Porticoccaceae bacterium]